MWDRTPAEELNDRLSLIESMIAQGRRHAESWGWAFALWGVVYYLAVAWSAWGHSAWAWPVSTLIGLVATSVGASVKTRDYPETTLGRAIASTWIALAISMSLLFLSLGLTGRLTDPHLSVAVVSAVLGMANGTSALILRWKLQFACAVVWWVTAVATCFGTDTQSTIVFLVAIFLCQIVFGMYGVISEALERKRRVPMHA